MHATKLSTSLTHSLLDPAATAASLRQSDEASVLAPKMVEENSVLRTRLLRLLVFSGWWLLIDVGCSMPNIERSALD